MKSSEVYLLAAALVFGGESPGCIAIEKAANRDNEESFGSDAKTFDEIFSPDVKERLAWGNQWADSWLECQQIRVLALCLMSAISAWDEKDSKARNRLRNKGRA